RLGWDTDRRHHRRALEQSLLGYVALLNGRTQRDFWHAVAERGWDELWTTARSIPTFGRLSAWSFCDYLHLCGVPIDCRDLMLEEALCTYKSWTRPNRRYPGVYADMLYDRIRATERAFPDEDWSVFWEARRACLPRFLRIEDVPSDPGYSALKQNWYRETGEI